MLSILYQEETGNDYLAHKRWLTRGLRYNSEGTAINQNDSECIRDKIQTKMHYYLWVWEVGRVGSEKVGYERGWGEVAGAGTK